MATDSGSRHAPDIVAAIAKQTAAGNAAATLDEHTDEQRHEMAWLSSLIGCASPFAAAAASGADAAAAASSSSSSAVAPLPLLRVTLTDGRVYTGRLSCVDSSANLVLVHASQEAGIIDGVRVGGFQIGHVLVAWKLVKSVQRQQSENNAQAA